VRFGIDIDNKHTHLKNTYKMVVCKPKLQTWRRPDASKLYPIHSTYAESVCKSLGLHKN